MSAMNTHYENVWEYAENAPEYAKATSDLWHWSTTYYDAGKGPITLFLDLIWWSEGEPLYSLEDASLGYAELDKLAKALTEYADRPTDVMAWVEGLLQYDEA